MRRPLRHPSPPQTLSDHTPVGLCHLPPAKHHAQRRAVVSKAAAGTSFLIPLEDEHRINNNRFVLIPSRSARWKKLKLNHLLDKSLLR